MKIFLGGLVSRLGRILNLIVGKVVRRASCVSYESILCVGPRVAEQGIIYAYTYYGLLSLTIAGFYLWLGCPTDGSLFQRSRWDICVRFVYVASHNVSHQS